MRWKKSRRELQKYNEGDMVEFEVIAKKCKENTESGNGRSNNIYRRISFYRKPHIRMFRTDPFDDAEMHLDMDESNIELDKCAKELEKSVIKISKTGIIRSKKVYGLRCNRLSM